MRPNYFLHCIPITDIFLKISSDYDNGWKLKGQMGEKTLSNMIIIEYVILLIFV